MLSKSVLLAAATLVSFGAAQNSTSDLPPGIDACCTVPTNLIPDSDKTAWCQAQRNTCPEICGGINQLGSGGQSCDDDTLEFTCTCKNGTTPDMSLYQQSVPGQMCRFWFDRCINATDQDLEQQVACQNQRDANCGNLTTSDGTTTSSAGASATATKTGGSSGSTGSSASNTAAGSSSTPSSAATALAIAREYGTPLLAGGMLAIFGLAL